MNEFTFTIITASILIPLTLLILRIIWVLPACYTSAESKTTMRKPIFELPTANSTISTMILLGSGGHTGEMIRILSQFKSINKMKRTYVISTGDQTSALSIRKFENVVIVDNGGNEVDYFDLPRARLIGEGKLSAVFRTLYSFIVTIYRLVGMSEYPDLLLLNGPGTAVPIAYTLFFLKIFGVCQTKIVYIESLARVNELSLTGKLLLPIADRLIVQWESLSKKYKRCEYHGILV